MTKALPAPSATPAAIPAAALAPVHLLHAGGTPDPTLHAIDPAHEHERVRLALQNPLGRWRGRQAIALSDTGTVVAWGEPALEAIKALSRRRIYRPSPYLRTPPKPEAGVEVFAASPFQKAQFERAGWPAEAVFVLFPPADPVERNPVRPGEPEDVLWWISPDAEGNSGWREAVWAITLLHITEMRTRRHRILLTGDGRNLVRARRFILQLGLPDLALMAAGATPQEAVTAADAALFLPEGPCDVRPALLARAAGLPMVHNGRGGLAGLLGSRDGAILCTGRRPREIVKAMLQRSRAGLERMGVDHAADTSACRRQWQRLLGISGGRSSFGVRGEPGEMGGRKTR